MNEAMIAKMVAAYFMQGKVYYSESSGEMLEITEMVPKHAANAAQKLLRDAKTWAIEADYRGSHDTLWMARTALFQALATRAG